MYRIRTAILTAALSLALVAAPVAEAAKCPSPRKDGKTVGAVIADGVTVNVKNVDYKPGKDITPPASPLNAGVSLLHQPLSSKEGSSVIVWHVNYRGCQGKLNVINDEKPGFTFGVIDENGDLVEYAIRERLQVKKGDYEEDWFMLSGKRQLIMVTCIGKVVRGSYLDNLVIIATPVS